MATKPATIYITDYCPPSPDSVGEVGRVSRSSWAWFDLDGVKDTEEIPFP